MNSISSSQVESTPEHEEDSPGLATPELISLAEFIQQTLPFNELPARILYPIVSKIVVQYHCKGDIFDGDTTEKGLRILRSGAVELRDSDNKLLDRLGEGESFQITGLNAGRGDVIATVIEDVLLYFLPDEAYRHLRDSDRKFDRYFSGQRNRRLRRAARYQPEPNIMMQEVCTVMSTNVLTVEPSATVRESAQAMVERRVSSVFVAENGELLGIVTDRDLRVRVVAKALPPQTPVSEIVRLHSLAHKINAVNTDERLKALASEKHLTITDSRNLADALHFIQQMRIKHQCEQIMRGEKVSNFLNPRDLPKMAKEQLRDAFTIIDEAQSAINKTYRAGMG